MMIFFKAISILRVDVWSAIKKEELGIYRLSLQW